VEEADPPGIVVGVRLQLMLVDEVVTDRVTVSEKPFAELTVIVEVSAEPIFPVRLVGAASIVKSSMVKAAVQLFQECTFRVRLSCKRRWPFLSS